MLNYLLNSIYKFYKKFSPIVSENFDQFHVEEGNKFLVWLSNERKKKEKQNMPKAMASGVMTSIRWRM